MNRPNVIIITCHDLGDYLGCYGTPVDTPNLNAFARQGVLLLNHFSTGSVCSPARGSILTGCYPHTHGLMGLVHRGWALNVEKCPPLPALLAQAGYETHLFGTQHEHYDPSLLGYQHVHRVPSHHADHVTPVLEEWLLSRPAGAFLAAVGFAETHRLGMNPSHFKRPQYVPADPARVHVRPYLPDIPEVREDLADFYGAVNLADRMFGRILAALDRAGLSENTLVIFTTDHGASFMHSKGTLYDGGTKVALLMRWPGGFASGLRCTDLTSHADVLPTVLDALSLPVPPHVQGVSHVEVARGRTAPHPRQYVFAEKNYTNYFDPTRMVRSKPFKYIRKGLRTSIFEFIIPEIELCTSGFRQNRKVFEFYSARRCTEELYDLSIDPGEMRNLAEDPARGQTLQQLRAVLDRHLEQTDDPFRHLRVDLLMPVDTYEKVRRAQSGSP